ncbi:MAG: non-heme iron oxygenase ferredoxin subunit [Burkholderiales bacterium]|nr:non-heme iron oxygenase ferredoxin subunit [Burkholderiales bacterium]
MSEPAQRIEADSEIPVDHEFLPALSVSDVRPGQPKRATIGDLELTIYNLGGTFYATEGYCTHGRAHLAEGYIDGTLIECRMHGGTFDICSGKAVGAPCTVDLKTYEVKVEGDRILVAVPRQGPVGQNA